MTLGARRLALTTLGLTMLVLPATACSATVAGSPASGSAQHDAEEPSRETLGASTTGGTFYVEWRPDREPIPLNEIFAIEVRVLDPQDRETAIENAVIVVSASMPEHNHGTTLAPRVEDHDDGTMTVTGLLLHMEGHWQLTVGVAVDGRMEQATFDIDLQP